MDVILAEYLGRMRASMKTLTNKICQGKRKQRCKTKPDAAEVECPAEELPSSKQGKKISIFNVKES